MIPPDVTWLLFRNAWGGELRTMLNESVDEEQIIARVAALDIGKAELVCWGGLFKTAAHGLRVT